MVERLVNPLLAHCLESITVLRTSFVRSHQLITRRTLLHDYEEDHSRWKSSWSLTNKPQTNQPTGKGGTASVAAATDGKLNRKTRFFGISWLSATPPRNHRPLTHPDTPRNEGVQVMINLPAIICIKYLYFRQTSRHRHLNPLNHHHSLLGGRSRRRWTSARTRRHHQRRKTRARVNRRTGLVFRLRID